MGRHGDPGGHRPAAYVAAIVANIVIVWVVNAIPGWEWPFVTADFPAVLSTSRRFSATGPTPSRGYFSTSRSEVRELLFS